MFDSKFIYTLIALAAVILAVFNFGPHKAVASIKENFGFGMNPSGTVKIDREVASSTQGAQMGDFYSVPGTYQAILNPRFSNVDYGANIRYNMPSYKNQGVPKDPLTFASMAQDSKEGYAPVPKSGGSGYAPKPKSYDGPSYPDRTGNCSSCSTWGVPSCGKGGAPASFKGSPPIMNPDYAAGNYNSVLADTMKTGDYPEVSDMVPVGDMTTVSASGDAVQAIVTDRFLYANRNNRLRAQGDWIRGDIPIVPCSTGWFRPSVQPNIDLQQGAMNVMGGFDNSTAQAMAQLVNAVSGDTTIGGVNLAADKGVSLSKAFSDVQITAFP